MTRPDDRSEGLLVPATPEEFLRDPVGRFVTQGRAGYLVWCRDPSLCGATYWGWPEVTRTLFELLALDRHPRMQAPFDVLTDTRKVTWLDDGAFQTLVSYVRERLPELGRSLRRHAIVHAGGDGVVVNAVVGLYARLEPRYSCKTFVSVPEALGWLGRPAALDLASELELMTAEAIAAAPDWVSQLRALLCRDRGVTSRLEAAERLGISDGSLRRALSDAGTTYRDEVDRARVARVQGELAASPITPMEVIARRAGFGSTSQLLRIFRRVTGEPPSRFRERRGPQS